MENLDSFEDDGFDLPRIETSFGSSDELVWQSGKVPSHEPTKFEAIVNSGLLDVNWRGDEIIRSFDVAAVDILSEGRVGLPDSAWKQRCQSLGQFLLKGLRGGSYTGW